MPIVQCHVEACVFATPDASDAVGAVMLSHHLSTAHAATVTTAAQKAPKINPPKITLGLFEKNWQSIISSWEDFQGSNNNQRRCHPNISARLL